MDRHTHKHTLGRLSNRIFPFLKSRTFRYTNRYDHTANVALLQHLPVLSAEHGRLRFKAPRWERTMRFMQNESHNSSPSWSAGCWSSLEWGPGGFFFCPSIYARVSSNRFILQGAEKEVACKCRFTSWLKFEASLTIHSYYLFDPFTAVCSPSFSDTLSSLWNFSHLFHSGWLTSQRDEPQSSLFILLFLLLSLVVPVA